MSQWRIADELLSVHLQYAVNAFSLRDTLNKGAAVNSPPQKSSAERWQNLLTKRIPQNL
jgi:hypothetical protein